MKTLARTLFLLFLCLGLIHGAVTYESSLQTIRFWFEQLVPSLLFFMVTVRMILPLSLPLMPLKALNLSKEAVNWVICCLLAGSPACVALIDEAVQKEQLSVSQGQRLAYCCQNVTPGYILISCGQLLLNSTAKGLKIYGCLLLGNLVLLALTRSVPIASIPVKQDDAPFIIRLNRAIADSGRCLFMMGGVLLVVSVSVALLSCHVSKSMILPVHCLAEFSTGIRMLMMRDLDPSFKECLICFILGFGSLSVHLQCLSVSSHLKLDPVVLIVTRLAQGLIAAGFYLLML